MNTKAMAAALAAACVAAGCSSALRGGDADMDVHLHSTYFLARSAGFEPAEAVEIAAADYYTDEHPETTSVGTERRIVGGLLNPVTAPRILLTGLAGWALGGEGLKRSFGSRTAEATAWTLGPDAIRLHFPARGVHEQVAPAFAKDPVSGELYYRNGDAVAVLERAFRALETRDPDLPRALALLGIGLHTLQDSYKHAGYDGTRGHVGADPNPDDVSLQPKLALEIAEATFHSLVHARRLLGCGGSASAPPWEERLKQIYTDSHGEGTDRDARWARAIRDAFGDDYRAWEQTRAGWLAAGGGDAFGRALGRIRRIAW